MFPFFFVLFAPPLPDKLGPDSWVPAQYPNSCVFF